MKAISDFLQRVLPEPASSSAHTETDAEKKKKKKPLPLSPPLQSRHFKVGTQTEVVAIPSTSAAAVYETPKPRFATGEISDDNDDDDDDDFVKGDTRASGRGENFGSIASPYILPYLSNRHRRLLDTR